MSKERNELAFVDEDIAAHFRRSFTDEYKHLYFQPGLPIQMQLARYVKKLVELLERYNDKQ